LQVGLLDPEAPQGEALGEHLETCAYCRAMVATYAREEQALRQSFASRIATSPSYADEIIERVQEEPIMSQLPPDSTPDQSADELTTKEIARRRLEAAQLALRPSKRRSYPLIVWLAPVAAVLLVALLATLIFTTRRPTAPSAPPPLALAPGVHISLFTISMVSFDEGWALGARTVDQNGSSVDSTPVTVLLHDHGGTWTAMSLPLPYSLLDISMVSSTDGWAVGLHGLILHYNGQGWSKVKSPTSEGLLSIKMVSATDGWASGATTAKGEPALILHYDGHSWQEQSTPRFAEIAYTGDLQPQPDEEVWALVSLTPHAPSATQVSPTNDSALLHYDGHQWRIQDSLPNVDLFNLSMTSPEEGWMIGESTSATAGEALVPFLLHLEHGVLTRVSLDAVLGQIPSIQSGGDGYLISFSMVSSTDGWLIEGTSLGNTTTDFSLHYDGKQWMPVALPELSGPQGFALNTISFQPDGDGWAVGSISKTIVQSGQNQFVVWMPLILHYVDGAWTVAFG